MSDLARIIARFPEHEYAIHRVAKSNVRFFELCIAYNDCAKLISKLDENDQCNLRKQEYQESSVELEAMILSYLEV